MPKVSQFSGLTPYIGEVHTMNLVNDATARMYMFEIVSRLVYILPKYGLRVKALREFYPRSKRLLGLNTNSGEVVQVRFRHPDDHRVFFPIEQVIATSLHEVAHCRHMNHRKPFWDLYVNLVKECERVDLRLMALRARREAQAAAAIKRPRPEAVAHRPVARTASPPRRPQATTSSAAPAPKPAAVTPARRTGEDTRGAAPVRSPRPSFDASVLRERIVRAVNARLSGDQRHLGLADQSLIMPDEELPHDGAGGDGADTNRIGGAGVHGAVGRGGAGGTRASPRPGWDCPGCGCRNLLSNAFCEVCSDAEIPVIIENPLANSSPTSGGSASPAPEPSAVPDSFEFEFAEWECPRCTFRNSGLLGYCEMCECDRDGEGMPVTPRAEPEVHVVDDSSDTDSSLAIVSPLPNRKNRYP